ncbi:1-(5-phosphoribosyl)-5-[(5-phosphoribosylamino)methylideneamino] imidazole-4-carboxamide isomerase [Vibrio cholerae]|nr:1-(5-phosphoribosyl)-5-[(5-phosphoribosylamino)methylideneamino] imidazole-4-carboxamide isomerase [Vibrio cholerae]
MVKSWIEKYGAEKIVLALDINIDEQGTRKIFPAMARWPVRTLSCIAISVVNIHKCSSNRPVALVHLPILRH